MVETERIAENIAILYQDLDGREHRSAIFKHYRGIDESHLYPVIGDFDVTQRSIERLYRFEREYGQRLYGLELCLWLDTQMSKIVNNEV